MRLRLDHIEEVVGVCSAGAPAMAESWRLGPGGGVVTHASVSTIADGIAVRQPSPEAVADMFGLVDDMVLVDEAHVRTAMALLLRHAGLVVEPAGAAGLAALVAAGRAYAGRRVATVICGGNVTPEQLAAWLA
jgi:threonine dehydratase